MAIAAGLAAMTWAALRYLNECWWCVPLGMTAGLLLVLGLCRWVDGSRLYELSLEEEAWEARRMREEDQREL